MSFTRQKKLPAYVDKKNFAFFQGLLGELEIKLSKPAKPISKRLVNLIADPKAKIVSAKMDFQVTYESVGETPPAVKNKRGKMVVPWERPITEEELDLVVFRTKKIALTDDGDDPCLVVHWDASPARSFRVRDLAVVIAETEIETRSQAKWLGGVDVHHIFFEGMFLGKDGIWRVSWGS